MTMNALVVVPEMLEAERLAELCRRCHVRAQVCTDGRSAVEFIETAAQIDILVTELSLPNVDGFEVLRRYRERFPTLVGRAVAISSFPELRTSAINERRNLGIDVVLASGTTYDAMLRVLTTLVSGAAIQVRRLRELEPAEGSRTIPPAEEQKRRATITSRRLEKLPLTPPDPELQRFVRRVASSCNAPIGVITIALDDQLVFPARHGLDATNVDRYTSLCDLVVSAGNPLFVPDAHKHPIARDNPSVVAGVVRGYASMPIRLDEGPPIGTLAVINPGGPLALDVDAIRSLRAAARDLGPILVDRAPA